MRGRGPSLAPEVFESIASDDDEPLAKGVSLVAILPEYTEVVLREVEKDPLNDLIAFRYRPLPQALERLSLQLDQRCAVKVFPGVLSVRVQHIEKGRPCLVKGGRIHHPPLSRRPRRGYLLGQAPSNDTSGTSASFGEHPPPRTYNL
jgi:hypothetical protein